MEENSPRVRPPAARTSCLDLVQRLGGHAVAARRRQVPGDVGHGLAGVVERAADVQALPVGGTLTAQPERAGDGVERAAELERGRGHDDGAVAEHLVAQQHRHAHRGDPQHRAAARVAADPGHVELALLEDALGVLEDLVDGGPRHLPGAVVVLGAGRLELGLHRAAGVAHPRQRDRERVGQARQPPLGDLVEDALEQHRGVGHRLGLGQPPGPLGGRGDHRGGSARR